MRTLHVKLKGKKEENIHSTSAKKGKEKTRCKPWEDHGKVIRGQTLRGVEIGKTAAAEQRASKDCEFEFRDWGFVS